MSDLLTHIRRLEMVNVDLDLEPQCESEFHDASHHANLGPQMHGGPATHYQVTPCGHWNGLRCGPHVAAIIREGGGYCDICRAVQEGSQYRFVEL